jgi:hypothetical protein
MPRTLPSPCATTDGFAPIPVPLQKLIAQRPLSGDGRVRGIHARLAERLREQPGPYGTMLLDFCDDDDWALVRALIACNDHVPAPGVWRKTFRC